MHCPFCKAPDTRVVDSRLGGDGDQVRRRRECVDCSERFTTYETAELSLPRIIKQDGTRQTYDENKLRSGLNKALEKRPVSVEKIEESISHIKHKLLSQGEREINGRIIGDWVMEELQALDHVAYIRFASVYLSFEDVDAFRKTIEKLEQQ
ncbi:Ribonucleotide reductase transcriptional regulator NrdR [hydrothermal vent metagenome]|uniref:Ribonucleotide reductase transcriptional regulator NrdR n=1 Tax=hydrothermal vent metagenome TaxID=652676 RepID=A0A3B0XCQ0_9ZZZZ